MMNTYSFYCKGYSALRNRKYLPMRFYSPLRYLWRKIANIIIPRLLLKPFCEEHEVASAFLSQKGIEKRCVVSLTSFPKRIGNLWQIIECLKRQTIRPDKILLYLSKEQFPNIEQVPESLASRVDEIFEIRIVDGDLKSYKKFYYSFQEFNSDLVLLVDDDIYYPLDMLEVMLTEYIKNPNSVVCRFGYQMVYDNQGNLTNYDTWPLIQESSTNGDILFGTGGGSLYCPQSLYKDVCNKELFMDLCPKADDIWINTMVRLAQLQITKLDCGGLLPVLTKDDQMLCTTNVVEGYNDIQIRAVANYYYNKKSIHLYKRQS